MKEVKQIRRDKVVDGLECIQEDFEFYYEFDGESVKLL